MAWQDDAQMARRDGGKFVPWKPERCADCPEPHPSLSHDGRQGPWRCPSCHARSGPMPIEAISTPPAGAPQGTLI